MKEKKQSNDIESKQSVAATDYGTPEMAMSIIKDRAYADRKDITHMAIPENVVSIGDFAFRNSSIQSIRIPKSVVTIGRLAFAGCRDLRIVEFEHGLKRIKDQAFYCSGIEALHLPDSVKTVDDNAFQSCKRLKTVTGLGNIREISNGNAIPYQFDVNNWQNEEVMQQVRLVVMCIDSLSTDFVKYCIEQEIHYIDITPTSTLIKQFEALDTLAKKKNVSIVLSVGITPGITNLLAKHLLNQHPNLTKIDLYILFGLGEKHGEAGYKWVFENMTDSYPLASKEKNETITSLSLPKRTQLLGKRTFYSFNFADQHALLRTTNARQVITRLAFDSRAATRLLYLLHRLHLLKPLIKRIKKLMPQMEKYGQMGSDAYPIKAVCWSGNDSYECSVTGNKEVDLTAYVATEIAKLVYEQPINRGILHINEVVKDIPVFLANLKKYDGNMEFNS